MNIFGLIATIVGCGTAVGITWLLTRKPISFKIIRSNEAPKVVIPPENKEVLLKAEPTVVTTKKEDEIKIASMDAVIKAANELMGIATEEELNGKE